MRIEDLPQIFRDAIFVMRRFKISYLWIDSLCIIQDSIEDWNKEAMQMSKVYWHEICNIAATGAFDSTKGLFFNKDIHAMRACKIQVPLRQSSTKFTNVYITDPNFWEDRIEKAPLIRRAWVVQERLLARRVLPFNQDQLYWEYREQTAFEIYPKQLPLSLIKGGSYKDITPNTLLQHDALKDLANTLRSQEITWSRILAKLFCRRVDESGGQRSCLEWCC
jgi:hypothetical protein